MRTIKISSKDWPLSFGNNFYRKLENDFNIAMTEIESLMQKKPIDTFIKMIYVSLSEGARLDKKEFTLSIDDVADLTDDESDVFNTFSEMLKEVAEKKSVAK